MGKWMSMSAGKTEPKPAKPALSKTAKRVEPATEQPPGNTLAAMQASQPPGWGWWGYLLADGGRGSIRGPYPDEQSALAAVQAEFNQPAVKLVPLPGSLPDSPLPRFERIEPPHCKPPVIECQICRHWTADKQNPPGGMGKCGKYYPGMPYPWHKCRGQ